MASMSASALVDQAAFAAAAVLVPQQPQGLHQHFSQQRHQPQQQQQQQQQHYHHQQPQQASEEGDEQDEEEDDDDDDDDNDEGADDDDDDEEDDGDSDESKHQTSRQSRGKPSTAVSKKVASGKKAGKKASAGSGATVSTHPVVQRDPMASFPERNRVDLVIQWLRANYEPAPMSSLPRVILYQNYNEFCEGTGIAVLNTAGFGRLLRQTFANLQTRRLGHRGQSKYFYQGIQVRSTSPLFQRPEIMSAIRTGERRAVSATRTPRADKHPVISLGTGTPTGATGRGGIPVTPGFQQFSPLPSSQSGGSKYSASMSPDGVPHQTARPKPFSSFTDVNGQPLVAERFMVSPSAQTMEWPKIGSPDKHFQTHAFLSFAAALENHLNSQMDLVERRLFVDACNNFQQTFESQVSQVGQLGLVPEFVAYIRDVYIVLFSMLLNKLLPNLLRPLQMEAIKEIRDYALRMETLATHIKDVEPNSQLRITIFETVKAFAQGLRRGMFLNHVAQAVHGVLSSPEQLRQMHYDWSTIDWTVLCDQANMVSQTRKDLIMTCDTSVQQFLSSQQSISKWIDFFDAFATNCLHQPSMSPEELPRVCRSFILKWTYVTSLLVRDLAVRAAPSFGSFQVLRLFADEFLQASVDDYYTRLRFPLYRGTRITVIHPSLLMALEATHFLEPPTGPLHAPLQQQETQLPSLSTAPEYPSMPQQSYAMYSSSLDLLRLQQSSASGGGQTANVGSL